MARSQIRVGDALGGVFILCWADGYRGDVRAVVPGRVNGEGAPAAADFKDAVARLDAQLAADEVQFLLLRGVQRIFTAAEVRAGIEHLRIEEKTVEAIAQIV